jgi:hypothetical protein
MNRKFNGEKNMWRTVGPARRIFATLRASDLMTTPGKMVA